MYGFGLLKSGPETRQIPLYLLQPGQAQFFVDIQIFWAPSLTPHAWCGWDSNPVS